MIPNVKIYYQQGVSPYNWIDITNRVLLPVKFYWQKRNLDYSLTLNDLELKLTKSAFSQPPNYYDNGEYRIKILIDGVVRFSGYIYKFSFNYAEQVWEVSCHQDWYVLQNFAANTNIYSFISSGATQQQFYTDNNGYSYVQILWLMKRLFYMMDLGLDVSDVENTLYRPSDGVYYTNAKYYRHLKLDLNMLQCLNQPDTAYRTFLNNIQSNRDYSSNKLNAWELTSYLCSIFGFSIIQTGQQFYKLYPYKSPNNRNYSIVLDETYSLEEEVVQPEWNSTDGFAAIYTLGNSEDSGNIIPSQERTYYYNTNEIKRPRRVAQIAVGNGKESADLMKHFMIIMENNDATPPVHNLGNTVDPYDIITHLIRPKYIGYKMQTLKRKVDFSKPSVNENLFVLDKNGYYSVIKQDNIYNPNFD